MAARAPHHTDKTTAEPARSSADNCYEWIKRQIVTNGMPPGTAIDERQLAEKIGVSRTPVREAVLRLRSEGFIENLPRRGAYVRGLTVKDLRHLYDVVTALEVMAVGLIAGRQDRGGAVAELSGLCEELNKALDDPAQWTKADEAFHRALLTNADNPPLTRSGLLHRDLAQRAHFVADRARPKGTEKASVENHAKLVELIGNGDAATARENHFIQRERGSQTLLTAIEALGLQTL
ncbi:GntR family transcriptional regulator [Roseovarius sp. MMSF_3281]|uniref:GntR family transcriptional regulator n=1 Tax=Roseovarius sp. MMSF_3281 TaxID=3046694 RepID=UPI00273D17D3|nr:GntR family transcriptional regulator [Roseovarius sp. MMSF_3281]